MASNNMHNLTTLIKRLEAATLRLEDIASSTIELPQAVPALQQTLSTASTSAPAPPTVPKAPEEPLPESVEEFDAFINESVQKFVKLSDGLDGLVAEQAVKVLEGFRELRKFLLVTTRAKKPDLTGSDTSTYQNLLKPINETIMTATNVKDANRQSPFYSHLTAVAEGMIVLAWVTVDHRPFKHVEDTLGSVQYFGNKILKEKNPQHVEWVQSYYQIFRDLTEYVKNYFPNGVTWNPNGQPAQEVAKSISSGAPAGPSAGGAPPAPPPPPPPPPPVFQMTEQKPEASPAGGIGAVFSELNRGDAVTKGLKKVDKSQMTHKNPALRASSTVPDRDGSVRGKSPAPGKKPKPESMRAKKPPKKTLDGNKWIIENFEGEQSIEIEAEISHSILISKCNNTTIIIKGKANAVTVENTNRLAIVLDDLISSVDVVKSQNFALQVMGVIPTVLMDQIDGAQVYLSKESSGTRVFSSKSSGINLNVVYGPDDDFKEMPLASQICSYFDEKKGDVVNEIVSHSG